MDNVTIKEDTIGNSRLDLISAVYWPLAGLLIGGLSVLSAWYNMGILVGSGSLSIQGSLVVVVEYTLLVSALAWLKPRIERSLIR